jgi:cobalt-zinc-cadmium efflux system protein
MVLIFVSHRRAGRLYPRLGATVRRSGRRAVDNRHPHTHAHHAYAAGGHASDVGVLLIALVANLAFTAGEAVAGLLAHSVALLADAGHNLSDTLGLAIALAAAKLAARPPTSRRSYGFKRAEVLSALTNGLVLAGIAVALAVEAARRLDDPPAVAGGWVTGVAAAGIAVNGACAWVLLRRARESLNVRGAAVHLAGDALSSVAVVGAGAVVLATGWRLADPIVALAVSAVIVLSAWHVVRDAVEILLEATPRGIDADAVGRRMASVHGVVEVHDLHIWTITSGFLALSAHVLVPPGEDCHARRRDLEHVLADEFGIEHTTLQVDHVGDRGFVPLRSVHAAPPAGAERVQASDR